MQIRKMTIVDYNDVYLLWSDTDGMGLRSLDDSEAGIARFLIRNPETCFVAETDGKIIGVILCGHDGRRGYIYHTAVCETRRGQGIGKSLVQAAKQALLAQGINKVALVAFRSNDTGNAFWQALGFDERHDLIYRNQSLNDKNI